jgi:uncharacterized OsmC-like protein
MRVVVLQSCDAETTFWAPDSASPEPNGFRPVERIEALTPDSLLLASLGSSTAQVLHAYAKRHGIDLEHVELRLAYEPITHTDQEHQHEAGIRTGQIDEEILFYGQLLPAEYETLLHIADQCSIHRMLNGGLEIHPRLALALQDD